jgi:hypothetical protein
LIGRTACGYSPGYSNVPLSFFRVGYFLLTSGVRIVFPNGSIHFCRSPWGLAWTLGIVVFLAAWSRFDVRIRLLTVLFFLWQGPYVVFGATESRYFYLGSVFALGAVVLGITQFRRRWLGFGLVFALVVCHAVWSFDRALLWKGDYREAQRIKARLEALAAGAPDGQLVVVNLPDHYGPPDLLWKPTMWRNGVQAIRAQIHRVNTPDCPFSWVDSGIPTMSREAIAAQYPRQPICEVMWSEPVSDSSSGQWQHFVVVPWKVHLPAAAAKNRDSPP